MKNILITGASGFLGQHLLNYNEQHNLVNKNNFYLLSSHKIPNYKTILHKNYSYDKSELPEIDTIIHMGAFCPKVRADINNIKESVRTISSCGYLLENLPNVPKKIIYLSTISVYGSKLINYPTPLNEKTEVSPDFLYGYSKLMSEELIKEYCHKNNAELCILRLGVSYGENDDLRQGTIPTIVKTILQNKDLTLFNNGSEIKHFIHTDDISRIILNSTIKKPDAEIINLVDDKAFKAIEIVNMVEEIYKKKAKIKYSERNQCNDSLFDNKVMIKNFGELEIGLKEGLTRVCQYYKNTLKEV